MGKYKFRLEKVLQIRKDREEESVRQFQEAKQEKDLVNARLKSLENNYKKYSFLEENESTLEKKLRQNYLNVISSSINETKSELQATSEKLEIRRNELRQRQIDRKTVEILKEKQHLAFVKEENFKEQKLNDELGLYAFIRALERR